MTISNSESPSQVAEKSLPSGWLHLVGNFQRNEEAGREKTETMEESHGKVQENYREREQNPISKNWRNIGGDEFEPRLIMVATCCNKNNHCNSQKLLHLG